MKKNNNKGFVGTDMAIAILAIIVFSGIIATLMYNNFVENSKIKMQTLAIIYLTETLENVGISNYDDLTQENVNNGVVNLIPLGIENYNYKMKIEIIDDNQNQIEIKKKIKAIISYSIRNKNYEYSMERYKIKE